MISTDFAANESWDDAVLSLKLLFQPWKWRSGEETAEVKKRLLKLLAIEQYNNIIISLFLSGRSALYFLLKSLNLPKGSSVLVQAFTCEAVVLPIIELGLKPVYIDIEPETFSMEIRSLTSRSTENCKVLILQHTFGLTPKNRDKIVKLAKERKLILIEDLAHGFNPDIFRSANYQLQTNNYLLLSFGRSKMLSSVFGGAIVSNSNKTPLRPSGFEGQAMKQFNNLAMPSYAFIIRCLLYKPLTMLIKSLYNFSSIAKMLHRIVNSLGLLIPEITRREKSGNYDKLFNFAYPNALAILLNHQLNKLEQVKHQRAKISTIYDRFFMSFQRKRESREISLIRYPLLIENRDLVVKKMREKNIYLGKWYDQVVAPKGLNLKRVEYKQGSCPVAEEVCKKIINLPTNITKIEAEIVMKFLNDIM